MKKAVDKEMKRKLVIWKFNLLIDMKNALEDHAEFFNNVLFPVKGQKYKKIKYEKIKV